MNSGSIQEELIYAASMMMQRAEIVTDVYETMLYALCFAAQARGAFLCLDGLPEYFDAVVGSFRSDRIAKRGGIKIWEYDIPSSGVVTFCKSSIWLYKTRQSGWLIGMNSDNEPNKNFIEPLVLSSSIAIAHIKRGGKSIDGRDPLTGTFDRGCLFKDLEHMAAVSNYKKIPLYLLFIDLNNFKTINDILGHATGDRVLISQAHELRNQVRGFGNVYRYGGDEFCVVICGGDDEKINALARRIELASEQAPGGISVSASVGVAAYEDDETVEEFIKRADGKMYHNKKKQKERAEEHVKST